MKVNIHFIKPGRAGTETRPYRGLQAGLTLVELIVAMVVISVALVGVMSVINYTTRHSADPVLRHQAIAIAESYMEEITLKDFRDPDTDEICPQAEGSRDLYDNVCDYDGLSDTPPRNHEGDPFTELANYSVSISVEPDTFGPAGATVDGLRIDVTVTSPANEEITLTSYRTDY